MQTAFFQEILPCARHKKSSPGMGELFSLNIKDTFGILLSDIVEINLFMPADLLVHLGEILRQDSI